MIDQQQQRTIQPLGLSIKSPPAVVLCITTGEVS
jgi:hypothetical protein